ncbi:MAG: hypothetical protein Q4G09_00250 [Clostridia bacterium]|nr:hypothetical protein [Clostridia bacterium]
MIYKNKPLTFSKDDIPSIEEELKNEIPEIIKEFNNYYNTKEQISVKYHIEEQPKGYSLSGELYFGDKLIKHYEVFDLLVLDLNNMELNLLIDKHTEGEKNIQTQLLEVIKLFMRENDQKALEKLYEITNDKIVKILLDWREEYENIIGEVNTYSNNMYEDIISYVWEKYNLSELENNFEKHLNSKIEEDEEEEEEYD